MTSCEQKNHFNVKTSGILDRNILKNVDTWKSCIWTACYQAHWELVIMCTDIAEARVRISLNFFFFSICNRYHLIYHSSMHVTNTAHTANLPLPGTTWFFYVGKDFPNASKNRRRSWTLQWLIISDSENKLAQYNQPWSCIATTFSSSASLRTAFSETAVVASIPLGSILSLLLCLTYMPWKGAGVTLHAWARLLSFPWISKSHEQKIKANRLT